MAYEALARKWRPKNFSELAGQPAVRQTLTNGLRQNRIYPVLLFTGPRGTGKTSTARILAKSLRCQKKKELKPCDQCEDCLLIQNSRHLDVMEIDGASNNGVEAVRELRDTISYMPSTGSWKIYIIDEVHMLSHSAFNALLKTLEEPPSHVLFIMATTESHKIPTTVLSRAQRLDFHNLSPQLIKKQLENISQKEKLNVPEEVLWLIARQARGSLRDAQSLLDHLLTFCGEDLTVESASRLLGLSDPHVLFQCLQALIHQKEKAMIELIESLRSKGAEPSLFLQSLIETIANCLFLKRNPENRPELAQISKEEIERIKKELAFISYEDLHFLFDMMLKGQKELAFCHDSQLTLEILLLRFCHAPRLESLAPLKPLFEPEGKPLLPNKKTSLKPNKKTDSIDSRLQEKNMSSSSLAKSPEPPLKKPSPKFSKKTDLMDSRVRENDMPSPPPPEEKLKTAIPAKSVTPDSDWRFNFLDFLKKKDPAFSAVMENLILKQKSQQYFSLSLPEGAFSYLSNKIKEPAFLRLLENQLTKFFNLKERAQVEVQNNLEKHLSLKAKKELIEKESLLSQAEKDPFVREVKDIFGGEIKPAGKSNKKSGKD